MNSAACDALLDLMSLFYDCGNYGPSYYIVTLPPGATLEDSLERYFSDLGEIPNAPQADTSWNIRVEELPDGILSKQLWSEVYRWFFMPPRNYSLNVEIEVEERVVDFFLEHLKTAVGKDAKVLEVFVTPPSHVTYDAFWNDFAFDSDGTRCLLHMGWNAG